MRERRSATAQPRSQRGDGADAATAEWLSATAREAGPWVETRSRHPERPLPGPRVDQSLYTSGVVGSADPPEFSTPVAKAMGVRRLPLAQPI
jgi:hypothetical protein